MPKGSTGAGGAGQRGSSASRAPQEVFAFFNSDKEAIAWGKTLQAQAGPFSEEEQAAFQDYTDRGFWFWNYDLRGGTTPKPEEQAKIDLVQNALADSITDRPVIVHRTIDSIPDSWTVGGTMQDAGFVSTSVTRKLINNLDRRIRVEIEVPSGSPGLYLGKPLSRFPGQQEFLLPHGTRFEVLSRGADPERPDYYRAELMRLRVVRT